MKPDIQSLTEQYLYCSFCGGFLDYQGENLLQCQSCLKHLYLNPKATNGAILENDTGEILLVKRAADPSIGLWDLPGGFVDLNESMEESLKRELQEELGITPKDLVYFGSYADLYPYQGIIYPTIGFVYTGKILPGQKVQATSDVAEVQFFKPEKIPFEQLAFESISKALKSVLKN